MCESHGWMLARTSLGVRIECYGIRFIARRRTAAPVGALRHNFPHRSQATTTSCRRATAFLSETTSAWRSTAIELRMLCGAKEGITIRLDRSGTRAVGKSGFGLSLLHHHSADKVRNSRYMMLRAPLFYAVDN